MGSVYFQINSRQCQDYIYNDILIKDRLDIASAILIEQQLSFANLLHEPLDSYGSCHHILAMHGHYSVMDDDPELK